MKSAFICAAIFSFFLLWSFDSTSQNIPETIDDIDAPVDTAKFYKKLFEYSKDKKVIYFLYRTIFNPPVRTVTENKKKKKVPAVSEKRFKGKTIRNIVVMSLDPLGTSINDTVRKAHSLLQKSGNVLHIKSRNRTIKNYLLFNEGDKIDPLEIGESERLLRTTGFIRDAKIVVQALPGTRDSFDILVLTQDYWSIKPDIDATSSRVRYSLTEANMLGLGHEFDNRVTHKLNESAPLILDGSFTIPNIGATYISPELFYGTAPENNIRGVTLTRLFYSPLTKVAGGLEFLSKSLSDSISFSDDSSYFNYNYRSFIADSWLGYSLKLLGGDTDEERTTRLIGAIRFARARFPTLKPDTTILKDYFSRSDFYLASLSLSSRKYLKERYIFKFGEIEDVPDGHKFTFTTGAEDRYSGTRLYYGVNGAFGRYFNSFGYLYFGAGYSTYLQGGKLFKSEVSSNLVYFSPLAKLGKWRARQFGNANFIYGINRGVDEYLRLNDNNGVPGYKSNLPFGTSRMIFTIQSVLYTPYEFLGFRFAPIFIGGFGLIGKYNSSILNSKAYQIYGIGLLIKNELLVLNSFQVTIALYPVLPDGGSDLRFSPASLNESRFRDFDISRPDVAPFR